MITAGAVFYSANAAMLKIRFPREAVIKLKDLYMQKRKYRKEQLGVLRENLKIVEQRSGLAKEYNAGFEELNKFLSPGAKPKFYNKTLYNSLEMKKKEQENLERGDDSEKPKEKWSSQYSRNLYNIRDNLVKR